MQISPNAEWTLRTDPHGTHTQFIPQTHIGSSTMMQVPKKENKHN